MKIRRRWFWRERCSDYPILPAMAKI